MVINVAPFTSLGVAISLFLGFHNNASYGRWWQARLQFGQVLINIRACTRFLLGVCTCSSSGGFQQEQRVVASNSDSAFIPNGDGGADHDPVSREISSVSSRKSDLETAPVTDYVDHETLEGDGIRSRRPPQVVAETSIRIVDSVFDPVPDYADWRHKIVALITAHSHALRSQLRPRCISDVTTALEDRNRWLTSSEMNIVSESRNPANTLLLLASNTLGEARARNDIDSHAAVHVASYFDRLGKCQASCECIQNTSLPLTYSLLVHRTTFLYVLLSPFAFAVHLGWWTPVFSAIVAYTFFGLDELARTIQEPFRDEPACVQLSAICRTIDIDVCEALGRNVPPALKAQKAVLM